jgi:hypothetical protein
MNLGLLLSDLSLLATPGYSPTLLLGAVLGCLLAHSDR